MTKMLSQNDSGVRIIKAEMKSSLLKRFSDLEDNEKLIIATLLDLSRINHLENGFRP